MILIFTECLSSTGLGHFARCTSIYNELVVRGESPVFILNTDGTIGEFQNGYEIIEGDWTVEENAGQFLEKFNPDISIVDSYLAQENIYKLIQKKSNKLVCIDDDMRLNYPEGSTIVNPGIIGKALPYNRSRYSVLAGTEFALLRKPFLEEVKHKEIVLEIQTILITTGGDDRHGFTPSFIKEIRKVYTDSRILVIIGPFFKNRKEIELATDRNVECVFSPDSEKMRNAMLLSDIAITAGGQTMYELARTGVPMIVFLAAENQSGNIKGFSNAGCAVNIGRPEDSGFLENLKNALLYLKPVETREKMSDTEKKSVDGRGAFRIVNEVSDKVADLHFRKAEPEDVDLYFEWANDPDVRKNSFNTKMINYNEHISWFEKKINSPDSHIFILENNNIPVGQIRFDLEKNIHCYLIDYSIAKDYQRKGFGRKIIELGLRWMGNIKDDCNIIRAYVKFDNTASIVCFQKNNFRLIKEDEDKLEFEFILRGNNE